VLTFIGAAAGYRLNLQWNVSLLRGPVAGHIRARCRSHRSGSMALIRVPSMIGCGGRLVEVTGQYHRGFPVPVGASPLVRFLVGGVSRAAVHREPFSSGRPRYAVLPLPKLCLRLSCRAKAWISAFCLATMLVCLSHRHRRSPKFAALGGDRRRLVDRHCQLEAVIAMLKISDGGSKVAMLTIPFFVAGGR